MTALRADGCGIALRAISIKSALRDLLSVSYGMISILRIGSLRSPPPIRAAPDFPLFRGKNKALKSNPFISNSQHNGALFCPLHRGKSGGTG